MLLMMMWLLVYSIPALVSAQQETDTVQHTLHTHQTNRQDTYLENSNTGLHTKDCKDDFKIFKYNDPKWKFNFLV